MIDTQMPFLLKCANASAYTAVFSVFHLQAARKAAAAAAAAAAEAKAEQALAETAEAAPAAPVGPRVALVGGHIMKESDRKLLPLDVREVRSY